MHNTPRIYPHHITLPQNLRGILSRLESRGYLAYIIGGCVRDSLLGIAPKDWDIATDAHPEAICEIFANDNRATLIRTGSKYGTIGVCVHKVCYEITTFRNDGIYRDARRPERVEFVSDLAIDITRRDFSINALAYHPKQGVLDYVGGVEDLYQKRIVCVGDARRRFSEDALRILRAMRFRATLGFGLDSRARDALLELAHLLSTLPTERIRLELDKILMGAYASIVLREFAQVFAQLFAQLAHQPQKSHARFTPMLLERAQHIDRLDSLPARYAWILGGFGEEMRATLVQNLCFSNAHKRQILSLLALLSLAPPRDDTQILTLLSDFGTQCVETALGLWALRYGELEGLAERVEYLARNACYELKSLQISGEEIKKLDKNIEGKRIGEILKELLDEVIAQKLPNMREPLINRAQNLLTQAP